MKPPRRDLAIRQVAELLSGYLDRPLPEQWRGTQLHPSVAAVLQFGANEFVIEWKSSASTTAVRTAIEHLADFLNPDRHSQRTPVVAVPFMGDVGRALCEEADVSWIDLSGNARITAPGIRILISGQPNRFRSSGRPSSVYAPKSSRIIRWLLLNPKTAASQKDIAVATGMDEGYTSRIVRRLERESLIRRDDAGHVRVSRPRELLDEWRGEYSFAKHTVLAGHIPAQSGAHTLETLATWAEGRQLEYAFTGLAAAWLYTQFAMFRLVTMFVDAALDERDLSDIGFRETKRGANAWIVTPNDAGVFTCSQVVDGRHCAHPIQVYLDLKDQPERSDDAAAQLVKTHVHLGMDEE